MHYYRIIIFGGMAAVEKLLEITADNPDRELTMDRPDTPSLTVNAVILTLMDALDDASSVVPSDPEFDAVLDKVKTLCLAAMGFTIDGKPWHTA
jgi:hypothetical protein